MLILLEWTLSLYSALVLTHPNEFRSTRDTQLLNVREVDPTLLRNNNKTYLKLESSGGVGTMSAVAFQC